MPQIAPQRHALPVSTTRGRCRPRERNPEFVAEGALTARTARSAPAGPHKAQERGWRGPVVDEGKREESGRPQSKVRFSVRPVAPQRWRAPGPNLSRIDPQEEAMTTTTAQPVGTINVFDPHPLDRHHGVDRRVTLGEGERSGAPRARLVNRSPVALARA